MTSPSSAYNNLEEFLDDLAINNRFEYVIRLLAQQEGKGWISLLDVLGRKSEAGEILDDLAFKRQDTEWEFSAVSLKVTYLLDEDFVNDGSALLVFNLVATRWLHTVWLREQNKLH